MPLSLPRGWPALDNPNVALDIFLPFLLASRWFGGKARTVNAIHAETLTPIADSWLLVLRISYADGGGETYLLPVQHVNGAWENAPARWSGGCFVEALHSEIFRSALFDLMRGTTTCEKVIATTGAPLRALNAAPPSRVLAVEQSNSSVLYDGRWFFKLYRRIQPGQNPDSEITRFLSEQTSFTNVPAFCGSLELDLPGIGLHAIGLLLEAVPNEGDAWARALADVRDFFATNNLDAARERAALLGRRTAELHRSLASGNNHPDFAPVAYSSQDTAQLVSSIEKQAAESGVAVSVTEKPASGGMKIRIHGDYHLGQVLWNGSDYVVIDFEGEPARSLAERREKQSPLRDVAGMLRSFDYAAHAGLLLGEQGSSADFEKADHWSATTSNAFLISYRATCGNCDFLPSNEGDFRSLLHLQMLSKTLYELRYEKNNRPAWAVIPERGLQQLIRSVA